jgi:hypothetical protein
MLLRHAEAVYRAFRIWTPHRPHDTVSLVNADPTANTPGRRPRALAWSILALWLALAIVWAGSYSYTAHLWHWSTGGNGFLFKVNRGGIAVMGQYLLTDQCLKTFPPRDRPPAGWHAALEANSPPWLWCRRWSFLGFTSDTDNLHSPWPRACRIETNYGDFETAATAAQPVAYRVEAFSIPLGFVMALLIWASWQQTRPLCPRLRPAARQDVCRQCGYDLRTHKPGDRCPECGTPVPSSHHPLPAS